MAYNNGFPINYQQMYPQYGYISQQPITPVVQSQPVANDNGIIWVQGEAGAKSWAVAPGKSVMLMDSENSVFYIKTTDNSGIPLPLRIFDYTERTQQDIASAEAVQVTNSQYVTKDELKEILSGFVTRKEIE
jgi:hypothetical protein